MGRLSTRIETARLRARIAAGRCLMAAFSAAAWALRAIPPESPLGRAKRRIGLRLRPEVRKRVAVLYGVFARAFPEATFVQIGANDGIVDDPLREFVLAQRWRGVLVEPVPYLFERLQRNYAGHPGLQFANVAIAERSGQRPFHYVREAAPRPGQPGWDIGLASFDRDHILRHAAIFPDIESRLATIEVPCCTFDELCRAHGIASLDLLHIDCEGYDFEVLKAIDFTRYRPLLLVYERHHLSAADREACRRYLAGHGYEGLEEGLDAICLDTRNRGAAGEPVRAAWRLLRDTPGYVRA